MRLKFGGLFRNFLLGPCEYFQKFSSRFGSGTEGRYETGGGRCLKYRPPPVPNQPPPGEWRPSRRSLPTPTAATGKATAPTSSTTPRTHVEDALCRFTCPAARTRRLPSAMARVLRRRPVPRPDPRGFRCPFSRAVVFGGAPWRFSCAG